MTIVRMASSVLSICILGLIFFGCTKQASDIILADVGPEKLTVAEYERQMVKSSGGWEAVKDLPLAEKEKFLNLLVKYRLKVLDAYKQGLDKDPDVRREMQEYRTSLAASFFLDKELVAPGLHQMYGRMKDEIRASHILIGLPPNPSPADTLSAWLKAVDIIKRAKAGEDFGRLVQQFSEDYSARHNSGDVYYFSSGYMVPAFEDACYGLKVGEISPAPVRTQFGYHVIKVTDRKPSRGKLRASHIMIRFQSANPTPEDTLRAYVQIKSLQDSLLAGKDFAELAKHHSEDVGSAASGGDLGFFERRRAIQAFEEVAFSLPVGGISGIVRTPYGYHLIEVTGEQRLPPMREMKQTLRDLYQNYRHMYDYDNLLWRYKAAVGFTYNEEVVDTLIAHTDSTKTFASDGWEESVPARLLEKPVFSFAKERMTLDSLIGLMKTDVEFSKMELKSENIHKALNRIAERSLIRYRTRDLENEYPEFKQTLKEYEEGILLYKSEQQHVWSKISVNDSLLRDYFEHHRERYSLPDRVNFAEIYVVGDSSKAQSLLDSLKSGIDFQELASRHTDRAALKEKRGEWGFRPVLEDDLTQKAWTMEIGETSGVLRFQDGYSLIKVIGKEKARLKTYEEALPEVAGHYHDSVSNHLEEEWVNELRKEFKVNLQLEKLNSAFAGAPRDKEE